MSLKLRIVLLGTCLIVVTMLVFFRISPTNNRTNGISDIKKLKIGYSVNQVHQLLGLPTSESGSGFYSCTYNLADASHSHVVLVFENQLSEIQLYDKQGNMAVLEVDIVPVSERETIIIE